MRFATKQLIWTAAIFIVAVLLWRLWIPALAVYEAPMWDEADRALDALSIYVGLVHFNPVPLFMQTVFFQTWGPLFSLLAQVPLFLFGPSAHSLTFVTFSALIFGSFGAFPFLQRRFGRIVAAAISLFAFFWMISANGFGAYWSVLMIDSWSIAGWTLIAFAGVCADVSLLIFAFWLLYAMKYQYYPVFFVTFLFYFLWSARRSLVDFTREFIAPWWAKALLALAFGGLAHVAIMKIAGPVYGSESWTQPRALRNPVHITFILATLLVYLQRGAIFKWLVIREWEQRLVRFFFWPATVLMAFPWPNRWAGVMVTQDYRAESHSLFETLRLYAVDVAASLRWPSAMFILLSALALAFVALVAWRSRRGFRLGSLPAFVSLFCLIQLLVLLVGVKNIQARYAFALYLSLPIGLFAYVLTSFEGRARTLIAAATSVVFAAVLLQPSVFDPKEFFLSRLSDNANMSYRDFPALYPIDATLGPIVKARAAARPQPGSSAERPVRLGLVLEKVRDSWDRSMNIWPIGFQLRTGVASFVKVYDATEKFCETSRTDGMDLLIRPTSTAWETVSCE